MSSGSFGGSKLKIRPSATTVNIQLPKPSAPWDAYEGTDRVQPTRIDGYVPANDRAYDSSKWTAQMDQELIRIMTTTEAGYLQNYSQILHHVTSDSPSSDDSESGDKDLWKGLSERDLRMRWNTYLKPRGYQPGRQVREVWEMKRKWGPGVQTVNGRWCMVPSPGTSKAGTASPLNYSQDQVRLRECGPTALEIAVQRLQEAEDDRLYAVDADREARKERRRQRREGYLNLDEVQWVEEEDLVLREAFEAFGNDWDRISRALSPRDRNADECRERLEFLSHSDYLHLSP
jgi:hypothetical protein